MSKSEGKASEQVFLQRQGRLAEILESAGLDMIALNPSPTLTYLTGLHFHLMERPVVIFFSAGSLPVIVLPELEMEKIHQLGYPIQAFPYGDNPATWSEAFQRAARQLQMSNKRVGLEPRAMRVMELRFLEGAAPQAQFISAEENLSALRMCKDASEVASMRKAVDIAQRALLATLPRISAGVSEAEIASELTAQLLRLGSQPEMAFSPIVSGGPNSANPHATPSERKLAPGDLLVIDWGATYQGYISDLTRTFAIGAPDPEMARIAQIVAEANAAGRAAARPGIPAGPVDRAARAVIDKAGYGPYFTHRVGHGIGMEGHEEPYMFGENKLILAPGMAFTIEPGIYLPGRNGARIEDNMVITEGGAECLSDLPRELKIL